MEVPEVINRFQWGARASKGELRSLGVVEQIVIHHAGGFAATSRQEGARQVLALQKLHQGPQGNCTDIAYHFLIDAGGHIYQGRPYFLGEHLGELPRFAMGDHMANVDSHKLGICLLGCFHADEGECSDTPTPQALAALERLLAFLCRSYGVHAADVLTHRDFLPTVCPGEKLYVAVAQVRTRLAQDWGDAVANA